MESIVLTAGELMHGMDFIGFNICVDLMAFDCQSERV